MKFPYFAIAAALLATATAAQAQLSPIRVRVEQISKTNRDQNTKTQMRLLRLTVSNMGKVDFNGVAKFAFYGRKAGSNDVVRLAEGDRPVVVKALATEVIDTPISTAAFTEEHMNRGKKVEASGSKFSGYGVQVFDGAAIVAEAYDPISVKEKMGVPAAAAKP